MASTNILQQINARQDLQGDWFTNNPVEKKPVKPLQFRVHPLIAIEHFIASSNESKLSNDEYPRYELFDEAYHTFGANKDTEGVNPGLINIKDVDIPNYEELRDLVNETVNFFRTEFAMQSLQGVHRSEWNIKVAKTLDDIDRHTLNPLDLQFICKLVPFYKFNREIAEMSNHCKSVSDYTVFSKKFKNLVFIKKLKPQTARDRGRTAYFFRTQSGHLLRVDLEHTMCSAIDTILNLSETFSIDISAKTRTMYSENFTYFVANRINEVGV